MKLNKKGFTLVELLAVIVVLAIIALIGYTTIGGVIEDSQHGANAATALSFEQAVITKCVTLMSLNAGDAPDATDFNGGKLTEVMDSFNGTTPTTPVVLDVDPKCETVAFGTEAGKSILEIGGDICEKTGNNWTCTTKP